MNEQVVQSTINQWGNGLAVRLNKGIASTAGLVEGSSVRIVSQPGRIVIEAVDAEPTLDQMLAAFDPRRHAGEVMSFPPIGLEVL
jgi:antitoxin MazE